MVALTAQGSAAIEMLDEDTISVPPASEMLAPVITAVPLQLLAYYMACERGCDVDMPKNLAKSVTVE